MGRPRGMGTSYRFMEKVNKNGPHGCWDWEGGSIKDGYGIFHYPGRQWMVLAHRVAAHWWLGFDLDSDLCVCHICDRPTCVNPSHLFIGTHADNMGDAAKKNRFPGSRGSANGNAKLSDGNVVFIRELSESGNSSREIGRELGVSHKTINEILSGRTWTHVE